MTPIRITNRDARRLWLWTNGLADTPTGPLDVMAIIRRLGFLQIDTIRNVTRAHNHILWSRNQNFREGQLWPHLAGRDLFEHFTHDASLIPAEVLPFWKGQFDRLGARAARSDWYQSGLGQDQLRQIRDRIATEGALSTHAFDTKAESREMWARPPHKKALDQMWYAGDLATCHRVNFVKFYDLGDRVFAPHDPAPTPDAVAWLCHQALDRLSVATLGEVQRFWDAPRGPEVKAWAADVDHVAVEVQSADGSWRAALAMPDIEARLAMAPTPTSRLRILNPFDPAIRDRNRLERLFGFQYRNEMFVPQAKRIWGYYVYPLLEGDRFVGRIELKADRDRGALHLTGVWPEPGVTWTAPRLARLDAELMRFAKLAGVTPTAQAADFDRLQSTDG